MTNREVKSSKRKEVLCQASDLQQNLRIYRISPGKPGQKKEKSRAAKSIKRARILGLLPFTHRELAY